MIKGKFPKILVFIQKKNIFETLCIFEPHPSSIKKIETTEIHKSYQWTDSAVQQLGRTKSSFLYVWHLFDEIWVDMASWCMTNQPLKSLTAGNSKTCVKLSRQGLRSAYATPAHRTLFWVYLPNRNIFFFWYISLYSLYRKNTSVIGSCI